MSNHDKDTPQAPPGDADPEPRARPPEEPLEEDALDRQFFDGEERTLKELKEEAEAREGTQGADPSEHPEDWVEGEEELRRIMAPRRSTRHPVMAVIVIGASLYGMWWLLDDMAYFFRSRTPISLGRASEAVANGRLKHNTYVALKGMPLSQSVASYKMRSLLGGSSKRRLQWLILADTGYQVLVSQPVTPISPRERAVPQTSEHISGSFTGRLRRLRQTDFDARVRRDYLRISEQSPMLRPFHRVTGQEILQKAGTAGADLTDVDGRIFRVDEDTLFEVFITFPGEYELDIHTDLKSEIRADILRGEKIPPLTVVGGDGAPRCGPPQPYPVPPSPPGSPPTGGQPRAPGLAPVASPPRNTSAKPPPALPQETPGAKAAAEPGKDSEGRPRPVGWGGSVFLQFDPKVFLLDTLSERGPLTAPGGSPGEPPTSGADLVVPVPPGTKVFNAQPRDCKAACRHEGPRCQAACSQEPHIEIQPVDGRVLVAAGGDCGGGKGEKHQVNVSVLPFMNPERAEAFVESLGHPYLLTEDHSKTSRMVRFIVKLPDNVAKELMQRQRLSSPYHITPRYEVFRVQWRYLQRQGADLVITRTLRGFPEAHEVVEDKGRRRLRPVPVGATLPVAGSRVIKADITQLLKLPKDAFVLEVGVKPSDMWMQPFIPGVPVFYLLLVTFLVLNLLAIRSYFRR